MTSKTENFYKTEKVAWDVSKPGYIPASGEVTLDGDTVINVNLFRDTDWIWTNIPSKIGVQHLTFADGYEPGSGVTDFSTPLSVRDCMHKLISINLNNVYGRTEPILFTEGLTKLEVYSDFLETFNLHTQVPRDPEAVLDWRAGYLEQIILSHTPNLTFFSVSNLGRLRELHADDFSHVTSMVEAFYGNTSLEYISPMYLDSCTALSSMFAHCKFSEFPTTLYNTSNVKSTYAMFYECTNLKSAPLFDTQNVTNMFGMFYHCTNLTSVPLLNTQNVTNMGDMFEGCESLTSVPLFDTQNVTDMSDMFWGCHSLTTVPLFNTQNVTDMRWMFYECTNLKSAPLFNTQNVTDMSVMFARCTNLTTVPLFNTQNVTDTTLMFENCTSLTTVPSFDMSNVTNATSMFTGCTSLTSVPSINMPNATATGSMFEDCANLTTVPPINVPNATSTNGMFENCTNLTSIPEINTSKSLKDTNRMFYNCKNLKSIPEMYMLNVGTPTSYDTINYDYIRDMFYGCTSLTDCGGFKYLKISIDLSDCPLTHESAMNVINKITRPQTGTQRITFSIITFNTLSEADIKIATDKGWEIVVA